MTSTSLLHSTIVVILKPQSKIGASNAFKYLTLKQQYLKIGGHEKRFNISSYQFYISPCSRPVFPLFYIYIDSLPFLPCTTIKYSLLNFASFSSVFRQSLNIPLTFCV